MTRVARRRRALLLAAALGWTMVTARGASAGVRSGPDDRAATAQSAQLELVAQTPTVPRGGTFELLLRPAGLPADATLDVVLHGRVRSRSELAASMEGDGLRSQVYRVSTAVATLAGGPDGTRRLSISLDPNQPGGVSLSASGAYPLEVVARDAAGAELITLLTHVLVEPATQDESRPLAVAVVVEVDAAPALRPDDAVAPIDADIDRLAELVAVLAANPDVAASLAVRPETVDALSASADPAAVALLEQLPNAADGHSVLAVPYVDTSPDALVAAGVESELAAQLEAGRLLLADFLRVEPAPTSWLAGDDLGGAGLAALARAGFRHVVVQPGQVEPLRDGVLSLSLAQPFLLDDDLEPAVDAMALDPEITARLGTSDSPGLETSRLLAELAMLWFEQPGIDRGAVLPIDASVRPEVLDALLAALDGEEIFSGVSLDDLFASAEPLRQAGGGLVDRALTPTEVLDIDHTVAGALPGTRAHLTSFVAMLGADNPRAEPVERHVLLSTAAALDEDEQRDHLHAANQGMDAVVEAVRGPTPNTITLTARDGTIPITLHNDAGVPVNVVVRLRSPKLEFPSGDTMTAVLVEPTTRLDIDVRVRASGSFPLEVQVISPDGGISLDTTTLTVQSTAVSGVGIVLSAGAALFLLVWWARHWHRTRRSKKLIASTHPATRPVDEGDEQPVR